MKTLMRFRKTEPAEGQVRLPDGTTADASGWSAYAEPVPNRTDVLRVNVSRPGLPGRFRIGKAEGTGRTLFPADEALRLIKRIRENGLADIIGTGLRLFEDEDDDGRDDDDVIRRTLRRIRNR